MATRPLLPDWAQRDRIPDMAWIGENMHIFWSVAQQRYPQIGRGAIVVDTTERPRPDAGHPYVYCNQQEIDAARYEDALRMVREYEPEKEVVIVLLKRQMRISVYRIHQV